MTATQRRIPLSFVFAALLAAQTTPAHAASGSVTLRWTAPGDDGLVGRAVAYDLRYSPAPITAANFPLATAVPGLPAPQPAGSPETFTLTNLVTGAGYYFAIRTVDEAQNWSPLSNVGYYAIATTGVSDTPELWLSPPWPNPARELVRWAYVLPRPGPILLDAFAMDGRLVRTITRTFADAGRGELTWDLRDAHGRPVAPGLYLVRATLAGETWRKRVVVAR